MVEGFRVLHERDGAFVIPNPWDVGSARILASMGFEALATTSCGMAYTLGLPEGAVTPDQQMDHYRTLVAATSLPVSADLEKGFGDTPESVAQTIYSVAKTGLAGGSIEDHTGTAEKPIFEDTLAVERITAAVEACRGMKQDFVLTARCEGLLWGWTDLSKVIGRLQAYEKAGADVLFAPGLQDLGAIREVCASLTKPVNVVIEMPFAEFGISDLADAGVKRISIGSGFFRVAYGAMFRAAREVADKGTFTATQTAMKFEAFERMFGGTKWL